MLQTPSGLALIEIQGTLHIPNTAAGQDADSHPNAVASPFSVGSLVFPYYDPQPSQSAETSWMKRVYLYIGKNQRLTGDVRKISKPLAIIRKRETPSTDVNFDIPDSHSTGPEELEIVEIVKYKILFSSRPEPVGEWNAP